jgi:hypothetical protein
VPLSPVAQYKHVASGEARPVSGNLDIGAYEAVTTTAPAPTPTPTPTPITWTTCAQEGGKCVFSGTRQVRYGAGTSFLVKTVNRQVACTSKAFGGDPAPGVAKSCAYSSVKQ